MSIGKRFFRTILSASFFLGRVWGLAKRAFAEGRSLGSSDYRYYNDYRND